VYTMIDRRTINVERLDETTARAQSEYFPKLQAAPGFVGFYLVSDERINTFTGITVWENKAHAEAFDSTMNSWLKVLEEYGHKRESDNRGETVIELQPAS
jgi:heme-degrading monooxygenase HmoA